MENKLFINQNKISIKHITVLCLLCVGIIPLTFLGWINFQHEVKDVHREVNEKHQLLAQNLTYSISAYLKQALQGTNAIASKYSESISVNPTLDELKYYLNFSSLHILKYNEVISQQSIYESKQGSNQPLLSQVDCITPARVRQQAIFSSILLNQFTKKPTLYLCQPYGKQGNLLLAEIEMSYFYKLQESIVFGRKGHAAIVNDKGQIIAHPNKNWVNEIKNISDWEIIQETIAGKTGTTSFFSDHFEQEMISGYANVSEFNWGVIVPQPMQEIDEQIGALIKTHVLWTLVTFLLIFLLTMFLTRKLSAPVVSLSKEVSNLDANNFQGSLPVHAEYIPKELRVLRESFQHVLNSLDKSNAKLKTTNQSLHEEVNKATDDLLAANIKLQRIITLDELTNMYNRRGLQDILEREVARVKRDDGSFTVLLCDFDYFKLINDNYGHAIGDNVLRTFSRLAQAALRERDVVGRWGGEEFLCILGDADYDTAYEIAERLRNLVADTVVLPDEIGFNVTMSIGFASYPADADNIDELIACADSALYEAKHLGRNKTVVCKKKRPGFFSIANQLRCALAENAIRVAFQPIFDVKRKQQVANRAMSRIVCEKDKILSAHDYLATAKQLHLMPYIDRICLEETFSGISANNDIFHIISVSKEFLEKENNHIFIQNHIKQNKKVQLILEVGENEFGDNIYEAKNCLTPYIHAGVQLSLKDFGGSGSSLNFLTEIPFKYIKVNDELLSNMLRNERTMLAMRSALRMCKTLGIKTIASNVADRKTKDLVEQMRFDWVQGYYFEKPKLRISKHETIDV